MGPVLSGHQVSHIFFFWLPVCLLETQSLQTFGVERVIIFSKVKDGGEEGALGGCELKEGQWSLESEDPPPSWPDCGDEWTGYGEAGPSPGDPSLQQDSQVPPWLRSRGCWTQVSLRAWALWLEASHGPELLRAPWLPSLSPGRSSLQ